MYPVNKLHHKLKCIIPTCLPHPFAVVLVIDYAIRENTLLDMRLVSTSESKCSCKESGMIIATMQDVLEVLGYLCVA
jgi:hypothetical protein